MKKLILDKKTGFSTILPFEIFDKHNNIFYSSDFVNKIANGERLYFNIPPGEYTYNGYFQKLDKPVEHKIYPLPKPNRNLKIENYKIRFGNNPNKCTIYYDDAVILFDNAFKTAPKYVLMFIYYHEIGHHFYGSNNKNPQDEENADRFAYNKMIIFGFNPSQAKRAPLFSLSSKNFERKNKIVNIHE